MPRLRIMEEPGAAATSLHCHLHAQPSHCTASSLHCLLTALPPRCTAISMHSHLHTLPSHCTASSLHCHLHTLPSHCSAIPCTTISIHSRTAIAVHNHLFAVCEPATPGESGKAQTHLTNDPAEVSYSHRNPVFKEEFRAHTESPTLADSLVSLELNKC